MERVDSSRLTTLRWRTAQDSHRGSQVSADPSDSAPNADMPNSHLCHSHIIAISQRAATSRIMSVLTQDLREFIASGMLTLKAKFETLEEAKIISRAAEVWSFFWSQVLPVSWNSCAAPVESVTELIATSTLKASFFLSPRSKISHRQHYPPPSPLAHPPSRNHPFPSDISSSPASCCILSSRCYRV